MRKRNHVLTTRFNDEEMERVKLLQQRSGLNGEAFRRKAILGVEIKEAPPNELPEFIRQLRLLNENLIQIAEGLSYNGADASDLESLIQVIYALESKIHKVYTQ